MNMLTVNEVAKRFGVAQSTVRGWIDRHELPRVKVGPAGGRGTVRILESELDKWMDGPKATSQDSTTAGLRAGRVRRTFVVDEAAVEGLKALAWFRRTSLSVEVGAAVEAYLEANSKDLAKARAKARRTRPALRPTFRRTRRT